MELVTISLDKIRPYERNPRKNDEAVAAEQNGRTAYLMEKDPRYVDVIIDRWEKLTGEKAVLLNEWQ